MSSPRAQIVGVIASQRDFASALEMQSPPDLFELRLDRLVDRVEKTERKLATWRRARHGRLPIIVTARHPAEGGSNNLSSAKRRQLIKRFLPYARYVDIELRSLVAHRSLLNHAHRRKIQRIISFHDLKDTPTVSALKRKARAAKAAGADIFKVATRTDAAVQLRRLIEFITTADVDLPLSVMGIGKLGALSRLILSQLGSALNYAAVGKPAVEGQLAIKQLRAALSGLRLDQGPKRDG